MTRVIRIRADVKRIVDHGGLVRFHYRTAMATLVSVDGQSLSQLDRRTYNACLRSIAPQLSRTQSGSVETADLVIEWGGNEGSQPEPRIISTKVRSEFSGETQHRGSNFNLI
jgi:hypothetical protein